MNPVFVVSNPRLGPGRKPKWGFLPAPTHLSDETREIKTRTCRFCMHAHLKSTQGADVSLGYCPLDLFSGDAARVTRALHALWDVWIGSGGAGWRWAWWWIGRATS